MSFALVAHVSGSATASGTSATFTTSSINTTGATLLVALVDWSTGGGAGSIPALTDSKGNTWTALTPRPNTAPSNVGNVRIYYVLSPTVGSGHTFTQTADSGFSAQGLCVAAFSGTSPGFDVETGNNGGAGSSTFQGGSLTPSVTNALMICAGGAQSGQSDVLSINSSYSTSDIITNGSFRNSCGLFYLIETSIVAQNPTVTRSTVNGAWECASAVFKEGTAPQNIAVPLATMATTKYAPGVTLGFPVPVGTLAFTRYAPGVTISGPVPAGSLAIATLAPGVSLGSGVPAASLVVATFAPGITRSAGVPAGSIAVSAFAPGVSRGTGAPAAASLTFATFAPSAAFGVGVPQQVLAITTYAPSVGADVWTVAAGETDIWTPVAGGTDIWTPVAADPPDGWFRIS